MIHHLFSKNFLTLPFIPTDSPDEINLLGTTSPPPAPQHGGSWPHEPPSLGQGLDHHPLLGQVSCSPSALLPSTPLPAWPWLLSPLQFAEGVPPRHGCSLQQLLTVMNFSCKVPRCVKLRHGQIYSDKQRSTDSPVYGLKKHLPALKGKCCYLKVSWPDLKSKSTTRICIYS